MLRAHVIVQDSPAGSIETVDEFLPANGRFAADRDRERFGISNTVRGYLHR